MVGILTFQSKFYLPSFLVECMTSDSIHLMGRLWILRVHYKVTKHVLMTLNYCVWAGVGGWVCACACTREHSLLRAAAEMVCSKLWNVWGMTSVLPVFIICACLMFYLSSCPSFCFIPSLKPCDSGFNKQRQVQKLPVKSYSLFLLDY